MNLRKINKEDIKPLRDYLNKFQPIHSSYAISNIFLWNGCIYDVYIVWLEKFPLILEIDKISLEKRALFFYNEVNELDINELLSVLNKAGVDRFFYVPQEYIIKKNQELEKYFEIIEQTDFNDYLYLSKDLSELNGSRYSAKRNLIRQFEKNYSQLLLIKDFSKETLFDIIQLWDKTQTQIDKTHAIEFLDCEKQAIKNIYDFYNEIDFFGLCVYIKNELKGFTIGSHLNETTCVLNFEKADKNIKGLYQYIDREFAKIASRKYIYINKESDLGKENLRKAKLSYHPCKIIKSYTLKLKVPKN